MEKTLPKKKMTKSQEKKLRAMYSDDPKTVGMARYNERLAEDKKKKKK